MNEPRSISDRDGTGVELFYAYADREHMHIVRCIGVEKISGLTGTVKRVEVRSANGTAMGNFDWQTISRQFQNSEEDARVELRRMAEKFAPERLGEVDSTPITDGPKPPSPVEVAIAEIREAAFDTHPCSAAAEMDGFEDRIRGILEKLLKEAK